MLAARRPRHEQGNAVEHTDALVARLAVSFPGVLAGDEVAIEKTLEICEIDAVIPQVASALGFIPGASSRVLMRQIVDALAYTSKRERAGDAVTRFVANRNPEWFQTDLTLRDRRGRSMKAGTTGHRMDRSCRAIQDSTYRLCKSYTGPSLIFFTPKPLPGLNHARLLD